MERPPADPAKLLASWADGETGDSTPGRVMADLKTGGMRDILDHLAAQDEDLSGLLVTWMGWEKGVVGPTAVLAELTTGGIRPLLERLAADAAPAEA